MIQTAWGKLYPCIDTRGVFVLTGRGGIYTPHSVESVHYFRRVESSRSNLYDHLLITKCEDGKWNINSVLLTEEFNEAVDVVMRIFSDDGYTSYTFTKYPDIRVRY